MTTQTQTQTHPVRRGFRCSCILCGEAAVSVSLDDVTTFRCGECDESFSAEDVAEHIVLWQRVLEWVSTAPVVEA